MKEISTNESTPDALRLFADISESKEVAISIYPEFLRDVANEIEQLEKKVKEYEHSSLQHRRLRRPWRNHLDVLVNKAKVKDPDIVKRLLDAYEDMRTGSRNDLKDAADEIERLRAVIRRWETCELVAESLCEMDNPESFCDTCKEAVSDD